jgi:hypothetical protein
MQAVPTTSLSKAGQPMEEDRAKSPCRTTMLHPSRSSIPTRAAALLAQAKPSNLLFQKMHQLVVRCSPGSGTMRSATARSTWTVHQSPSPRAAEPHRQPPSQIVPTSLLPTLTMAALQSRAKRFSTPTQVLLLMSRSRTQWPMIRDLTPERALQ